MEKLNNTVIKVLNREHGKKVIEWWESQGVDTVGFNGVITLDSHGEHAGIYYGVIDGRFSSYSEVSVKLNNAKIIELPQEKDYSIKGTPLPVILEGTKFRCFCVWIASRILYVREKEENYVSFGLQVYNGEVYVLYEKKDYTGGIYLMTPLSIIQELDKKEQSKSEPMKTRTITSEQGQQIIDAACSEWKEKLFNKWGKQIVLKQEISVEEDFYQQMRKACTGPQNKLFDKIFGKEEKLIPKGTPCLVRDETGENWKLVYSNGNGTFTGTWSTKATNPWKYVQILDINNLPTE